ncbi:hypothetical protein P175DRAFT_0532609 [Aspergillus ochraceoroseus IBT 24754]|uniref:Uncharacterized protein n=1 Tax=Aspergillus ochraceoroseus IBT 24754 TaxID=1392256 RepID=A0A2T5LYB1_9EURO|nr:uncharacterized protein P175DRAFT_0532609 [Aspergillus ochraceoroseus IBT 24754]PTU21233.1 hypothetical protein P175DRAFT_0532609 [Aspergillus ochraceoroseus IBT 24754]
MDPWRGDYYHLSGAIQATCKKHPARRKNRKSCMYLTSYLGLKRQIPFHTTECVINDLLATDSALSSGYYAWKAGVCIHLPIQQTSILKEWRRPSLQVEQFAVGPLLLDMEPTPDALNTVAVPSDTGIGNHNSWCLVNHMAQNPREERPYDLSPERLYWTITPKSSSRTTLLDVCAWMWICVQMKPNLFRQKKDDEHEERGFSGSMTLQGVDPRCIMHKCRLHPSFGILFSKRSLIYSNKP